MQAEAAQAAKITLDAEKRCKLAELSASKHGYKNLMKHAKKNVGSGISVVARDHGELTANVNEIHSMFLQTWTKI